VVVVVTANPSISDVWVEDCSIAAYTLQLCAREKGLGSCWSQIRLRTDTDGNWAEEHVRKILNLPEELAVDCIIAMGYPAEKKEPYTDADGDWTKIHYNTY
jgi:nitroreductase